MTFQFLPEKVLHRDIYIFQLNVLKPGHSAISKEVMERAVLDFNDRPMRFGEYGYKLKAGREGMMRHLTIHEEHVSHIPRNVRVEDGWLMADIEIRPRTVHGQYLMQLGGADYPARTLPEEVLKPFLFTARFFFPNQKGAEILTPTTVCLVTIDAVNNPYLKADNGNSSRRSQEDAT